MSTQPTAGPPISTSTMIAGELPMAYVPWSRYRFGAGTPQYAGLTSAEEVVRRQEEREAAGARRVARASLRTFTPTMALQDMRAAALSLAGRPPPPPADDEEYSGSWLRGMALWCALAAVTLAAARW